MDIIYKNGFVLAPDIVLASLVKDLEWERRGNTPRMEYYANKNEVPYTYGSGMGVREYLPKPWHPYMDSIKEQLKEFLGANLDVCFLNRYEDQSDHLGWHADDSPEMDDARPIAIISLGVAREIWFKPRGGSNEDVQKLLLEHGSLCVMPAGFQDTHLHRIPKAGFQCGRRISLTYRGYVTP